MCIRDRNWSGQGRTETTENPPNVCKDPASGHLLQVHRSYQPEGRGRLQGGSCQSEKDRDREPACLTEGGCRQKADTPPFLIHANGILHAISILRRLDQSQLLKFQDKAADRRVGGVPKVLFQLLGGKLCVAVGHILSLIASFSTPSAAEDRERQAQAMALPETTAEK